MNMFKKNLFTIPVLLTLISFCAIEPDTRIRVHPKDSEVKPSYRKFYDVILPSLNGKKILLVTNPSGIGNNPEFLKSEFKKNGVKITHLIGLEHGFLGLEEDFSQTPVTIDPLFNVPIYHIYRLKKSELANLISEVDSIIFDVQDMGMRCYTYLTVLKRIMEHLTPGTKKMIILDHINPALQIKPAGDFIRSEFENFAGEFPSTFFTGLTIGESANYYNESYLSKKVHLEIIPVEKYKRSQSFEESGLEWHTPSPNLPDLESARNYFALVFLEGINISVGRGTAAPFVYFGAPWMKNPEKVAEYVLSRTNSKDYFFSNIFFKPVYGPYKDQICRGLRMNLVNRNYNPVELGYILIQAIQAIYKNQFSWQAYGKIPHIDYLWGSDSFRKSINSGIPFQKFHESYASKESDYLLKIKKFYLY